MPITKKQQIRGIRILLTVFYGFLLSSILFRYLVHGIIALIQTPLSIFAIALIIIGALVLISIGLSIYATWFDNTTIMIVSGVVLIFVFIMTLVFGVLRIWKSASHHATTQATGVPDNTDDADPNTHPSLRTSSGYVVAEDVTGLIIELISILFAILGTFVLYRYVRNKYAPVSTNEPAPPTTPTVTKKP